MSNFNDKKVYTNGSHFNHTQQNIIRHKDLGVQTEVVWDKGESENDNISIHLGKRDCIKLGVVRREELEVQREYFAYNHHKFSCTKLLHEELSSEYYLPNYREKAVTYNYLVGIDQCEYACPKNVIPEKLPPDAKEVTANKATLYYELRKNFKLPLGYDNTNLPSKQYLVNALFLENSGHPLFVTKKKNVIFKAEVREDLVRIPVNCSGLLQPEPTGHAQYANLYLSLPIRQMRSESKRMASVVKKVEVLQALMAKTKKEVTHFSGVFKLTDQFRQLEVILSKIK